MVFRLLDKLVRQAEEGKSPLKYQRAGLAALSTFFRRPADVTKQAPHIRDATDLKRFMLLVVAALLPCLLFGIWNTGRGAYLSIGQTDFTFFDAFLEGSLHVLPLVLLSYAVGGFCEMIFAQLRNHEIAEGFLVTGMLYPLVCPATIPWWMFTLGIIFGVVIGKEVFGGTGQNVFNPALVARAFLFFAYPAQMSGEVWVVKPYDKLADGTLTPALWTTIPADQIGQFIAGQTHAPDAYSGATALAIVTENAPGLDSVAALFSVFSSWDMFVGLMPGSIGEVSTLMCLIGAFILVVTGIGSWRTMVGVFAGGLVMASLFYFSSSDQTPTVFALAPHEHLLMGGFAFGAIFMATDPVSSPLHNTSRLIYGFLIGALCILIRTINPAFPEGMMLSILFMNIFAALIDHYVIRAKTKRRAGRV